MMGYLTQSAGVQVGLNGELAAIHQHINLGLGGM